MKEMICFSLLCILSFGNLSIAHKYNGFQGERSLISQEALMTPFPMRVKIDSPVETTKNMATLTADRMFIKDGGHVKIMAEILGISWQNDNFLKNIPF